MARVNLILLLALTACALGLVTSQHKARKLFAELEHEQERARLLDVEWGQLQLEQSTWAMHARVEKIARERLRMSVPDARRTQVVMPGAAPEASR
jgi:cell division protein FtsL